jgi:ABC-type branched-subunit amino acid transport system substrate-binding protein
MFREIRVRARLVKIPVRIACLALLASALFALIAGCSSPSQPAIEPLTIGVLLPLTGPNAIDAKGPLDWALANVNDAGGVAGRHLAFDYADLGNEDLATAARRMAADPSVVAVIGPDSSQAVFTVMPLFIQSQKVVVTPTATAGGLYRAFADSPYFWRTVQSDIQQVGVMLLIAARDGAERVALVTAGDNLYGDTFFDWFAFTAAELGLEVTTSIRFDQVNDTCDLPMSQALASQPDAVLAVPIGGASAVCMAQAWRTSGSDARLLFSDGGEVEYLIDTLGDDAEGIEGTAPSWSDTNGFEDAFVERFGTEPTPYAANIYDAVLAIAYGLARSGGVGGAPLPAAIAGAVDGRGAAIGWDAEGIRTALLALGRGDSPNLSGATGPLDFDLASHSELLNGTYEHWVVRGGQFEPAETFASGESPDSIEGLVAFRKAAASPLASNAAPDPAVAREELWALLVAVSTGWDNYRHQADVLAQYQMLRANGVPDDHIVLIMADDLANSPSNPEPGVVRQITGGPDLYENAEIDYLLADVTPGNLLAILSGDVTPKTPTVVGSTSADNVYVFIAGHGEEEGVYLGYDRPILGAVAQGTLLTPDALRSTLAVMNANDSYRQMLIAIESCKGGTFGVGLDVPDVLLLSGASQHENSLSTNFDTAARIWRADQFAYELWRAATTAPASDMSDIYATVYDQVAGSHVSAYGANAGAVITSPLRDFVAP